MCHTRLIAETISHQPSIKYHRIVTFEVCEVMQLGHVKSNAKAVVASLNGHVDQGRESMVLSA